MHPGTLDAHGSVLDTLESSGKNSEDTLAETAAVCTATRRFLVEENQFGAERVAKQMDRLRAARAKKAQVRRAAATCRALWAGKVLYGVLSSVY